MNSFFRNATLFKALYKENYFRNVICNGLALGTFKIYQRGFLKVATIHPVSVPGLNPLRKVHRWKSVPLNLSPEKNILIFYLPYDIA